MLTLRDSGHIATARQLKGRGAVTQATGFPRVHLEAQRLAWEKGRLAAREAYRRWRQRQWDLHFAWVAGPLRVLPAQARLRLSQSR
jgi:hypothetical protein